jgi:hypothetical protein
MIHDAQGNYKAALQNLEQALQTLIDLGLESSPNAQAIGKSIEVVKSKLKR